MLPDGLSIECGRSTSTDELRSEFHTNFFFFFSGNGTKMTEAATAAFGRDSRNQGEKIKRKEEKGKMRNMKYEMVEMTKKNKELR